MLADVICYILNMFYLFMSDAKLKQADVKLNLVAIISLSNFCFSSLFALASFTFQFNLSTYLDVPTLLLRPSCGNQTLWLEQYYLNMLH